MPFDYEPMPYRVRIQGPLDHQTIAYGYEASAIAAARRRAVALHDIGLEARAPVHVWAEDLNGNMLAHYEVTREELIPHLEDAWLSA